MIGARASHWGQITRALRGRLEGMLISAADRRRAFGRSLGVTFVSEAEHDDRLAELERRVREAALEECGRHASAGPLPSPRGWARRGSP